MIRVFFVVVYLFFVVATARCRGDPKLARLRLYARVRVIVVRVCVVGVVVRFELTRGRARRYGRIVWLGVECLYARARSGSACRFLGVGSWGQYATRLGGCGCDAGAGAGVTRGWRMCVQGRDGGVCAGATRERACAYVRARGRRGACRYGGTVGVARIPWMDYGLYV